VAPARPVPPVPANAPQYGLAPLAVQYQDALGVGTFPTLNPLPAFLAKSFHGVGFVTR
jgi:hypothetical protein